MWILINMVLLAGLATLAVGFFWKDRRTHLVRIVGSILLALFFSIEIIRIINEGKDAWNVTFTAIAPPVFVFVAWQEWLSYRWDEDHTSLKWIVGTAFIAGSIYYAFDRIPQLTAAIVYVVAAQSVWFGQIFGYGFDFYIGDILWDNEPLAVSIENAPVRIILGCTGIEAIVIFVGAILATELERDPWLVYKNPDVPKFLRLRGMSQDERRSRAMLYAISIVWVGNLLRNVLIIYLVDVVGWEFEFVHGTLAKSMSFGILLGLAFMTFNLIPEMLDNISGIAGLTKRMSPEEREFEEKARKLEEEDKEGEGEEDDSEDADVSEKDDPDANEIPEDDEVDEDVEE
jgi:exosortase/archaeosortase family protein